MTPTQSDTEWKIYAAQYLLGPENVLCLLRTAYMRSLSYMHTPLIFVTFDGYVVTSLSAVVEETKLYEKHSLQARTFKLVMHSFMTKKQVLRCL